MAVIMGWGKCSIAVKANTGSEFPDSLAGFTLLENIKEDATSIEMTEGDEYVAKTTGGIVIARERAEGAFTLKTTLLEPSEALYTLLGIGTTAGSAQNITSTVVNGIFSVRLDPRNVGAVGIEVPTASVTATPKFSDKEGWSLELSFSINHNGTYHYRKYTKKKAGLANTDTGKA